MWNEEFNYYLWLTYYLSSNVTVWVVFGGLFGGFGNFFPNEIIENAFEKKQYGDWTYFSVEWKFFQRFWHLVNFLQQQRYTETTNKKIQNALTSSLWHHTCFKMQCLTFKSNFIRISYKLGDPCLLSRCNTRNLIS